ncbi:hypothetical protein [Ornithinimicrobium murale]|uniref:hypothetical protein n=1 Tax=Ornithinimicrobium murale TaxID=1050153 RepID=UPI000E0D2A63|nr:hypothetical protein [Ornithinimicrobium murale]
MNTALDDSPDPWGEARVGQHLCRAVGQVDFDYAALVEGVHHRAGRIRRRRALTTGAITAVVAPALLGGSAMVFPGLLPGGVGTVTPAETPLAAVAQEPTSAETPEADLPPEGHVPSAAPADPMETRQSAVAEEPPWQETAPPLPEGGTGEADQDNAWDVPDARPTGVDLLEALGTPVYGSAAPQIVPVSGVMACDLGQRRGSDPVPLAGQAWMYYDDQVAGEVSIQVTGWEDSTAARDDLREGTMTYCVHDTDGDWERIAWPGHEGDEDYLLYQAASNGIDYSFAVVRQGDYVIGVTVTDDHRVASLEVAAELASKTADNMQALDPVHGRD